MKVTDVLEHAFQGERTTGAFTVAYAEHTSSSWLSLLYMWMLLWQLEGFSSYLRKGISEANQRAIIIPSRNHFLVVLNTSHSWLSLVVALSNLSWLSQGEESWFRSSFGWTSFWTTAVNHGVTLHAGKSSQTSSYTKCGVTTQ